MTETNFFQSWAFWFLAGIIVGFVVGFILAIIMAASGKASRMEERMESDGSLDAQFIKLLEEANRLGVGEKEFIDNVLKRYKRVPEIEIATQGKPEDN